MTKERFNVLMEPLVDQIENEAIIDATANEEDSTDITTSSNNSYRTYVIQHLALCIGNFASCCINDDTLVRKLNYQILLKTKHDSVQVNRNRFSLS